MAHQLFIDTEYKIPKGYTLEADYEFPSSIFVILRFYVTNIGDKEFPGGILKKVEAHYDKSAGSLTTFYFPDEKIKPISKGQRKEIYKWNTSFMMPGLAWLRCKIEAKDGQEIEYYQLPEKKNPLKESWNNAYRVVPKENLEIIKLLKAIKNKLT